MSPPSFKADDLVTLGKWKVNLVRAQICRNWGVPDAERNLTEYNHWMVCSVLFARHRNA